jgi:hypothetical protein
MPKGVYGRRQGTGVSISKLTGLERKAYIIWAHQKYTKGVEYSCRDFIDWYVKEFKKKKWKRANVARFDHDKPYSFDNVELQEQLENCRERNERRGNPCRSHKKVDVITFDGKFISQFSSKIEAARFYGISEKTVYNHCQGRTKQFFKFGGGKLSQHLIRFQWSR